MARHDKYTQQQLTHLGKRLREFRIQKGFSNYEHFAYEHDMSRSQYGNYENGGDLRFSTLLKVLKAMDVSLDEFFSDGFIKHS
jgi:transcriptional regulator with XRE-family HTH domain